MLMRTACRRTTSSLEMTCKDVLLHSNDIEIHTTSTGSDSVIMSVKASEGFFHSKITRIGRL